MIGMIATVRALLQRQPFTPFSVVMCSGQRHSVPSRKHASVNPQNTVMVVWYDDGGVILHAVHITTVDPDALSSAV